MKTKGMTIPAVRVRISELQAEISAAEQAPFPRAEIAAALQARFEASAQATSQSIRYRLRRFAPGSRIEDVFRLPVTTGANTPAACDVGGAVVTMLGIKAVMAGLAPFLDELPDGVTRQDRQVRIGELQTELDALEHAEETAVEASEAAGAPIGRRGDARPEIVLRVQRID